MTHQSAVEKRWISCNLCASHDFEDLYEDELGDNPPLVDYNFNADTRKTFKIVRCKECGLVFTNPMPSMGAFYTETVDDVYLQSESQRRSTAVAALKQIVRYKDEGTLLDIGCATGVFLDAAQQKFQVEGIELSNWAASLASKKHKIYQKPLKELEAKNKYDVITLWGVIEHFEDPKAELSAIADALAPEGLFVIYTGNVDAWLPKLLGKKWWWYQGMHLYYFSEKTLTRMLKDLGLEVVSSQNHKLYFQLFSLAVSLQRYKISKLINPILNSRFFKGIQIPLKLSGEMVLFAKKSQH